MARLLFHIPGALNLTGAGGEGRKKRKKRGKKEGGGEGEHRVYEVVSSACSFYLNSRKDTVGFIGRRNLQRGGKEKKGGGWRRASHRPVYNATTIALTETALKGGTGS